MSLSSIATEGFLQNGSVSCVATEGFLCTAVQPAAEAFSGGWYDMEALRPRKFKAKSKKQREAKPVLDDIAEQLSDPGIQTQADLEIVLRMRLRLAGLEYQNLYLTYLQGEMKRVRAARRKRKAITHLLLH